jgi:hypothetical protein
MIKKLFLFSVIVSQLTISCSNNDDAENTTEGTLNEQIAALLQKPYSTLTPDQQKAKLEAEANDMLKQMENSKSSTAIDAFENLESLFSVNVPKIQIGKKTAKTVQEVLNVSDVYGVFTWDSKAQAWTKTASTSELKFVFPANEKATTNNAILTASSVASKVKIVVNDVTNEEMYLPSSVTATLTIAGNTVGKYEANATYVNGKPEPTEASYKLTLNGYVFENSAKRTSPVSVKSSFSHEGKNLIGFNVGSTADIDKLMEGSKLTDNYGKANCLISLMDNFVIVADMDFATQAKEDEALEKSLINPKYPNYEDPKADYKAYYTAENTYNKQYSDANVASFNKNAKMILVSKKDGTKIADVVRRSEKKDSHPITLPVWVKNQYYTAGGYWSSSDKGETITVQYYDEVLYLKFNDKTEVSMSSYFSSGFGAFETKFQDFLKAFQK